MGAHFRGFRKWSYCHTHRNNIADRFDYSAPPPTVTLANTANTSLFIFFRISKGLNTFEVVPNAVSSRLTVCSSDFKQNSTTNKLNAILEISKFSSNHKASLMCSNKRICGSSIFKIQMMHLLQPGDSSSSSGWFICLCQMIHLLRMIHLLQPDVIHLQTDDSFPPSGWFILLTRGLVNPEDDSRSFDLTQ